MKLINIFSKHSIFGILIAMIVLGASLASCDLDEKSYVEVGKKNYTKNASEAENVLLGVYAKLSTEELYSYYLSLLFTISSDIAQCEGSANTSFRVIPTNSHNPSTTEIYRAWKALYSTIYNANDFIETVSSRMNEWSAGDQKMAEVYLAEARSLRALMYFELVRWYGNVPILKTTAQADAAPSTYVQEKPETVFAFIEEDLQYAVNILPWAVDDNIRQHSEYRLSKGSVLGLLTKVYATWAGYPVNDTSKWEKAIEVAQKLIESGKHDLNPDYESVWKNTCNGVWDPLESLIEVSFYSPTSMNRSDPTGRIGKWNGVLTTAVAGKRGRCAANWKVVYPFTQEWEKQNDPRFALSIADYRYGYRSRSGEKDTDGYIKYLDILDPGADENKIMRAQQTFTPAKWDIEKYVDDANFLNDNDQSNVNWYILRYSDVLLLYAEAINEVYGPTTKALAAINKVRERGFGDSSHNIPSGLTQDKFREIIRKERAYELCFEGHRKQDLIRWGIYYDTIVQTAQSVMDWFSSGNYSVVKYTNKGKHELMPIPQRDLDLMTSAKQNPGWGK